MKKFKKAKPSNEILDAFKDIDKFSKFFLFS
jgi:hypothetical protein